MGHVLHRSFAYIRRRSGRSEAKGASSSLLRRHPSPESVSLADRSLRPTRADALRNYSHAAYLGTAFGLTSVVESDWAEIMTRRALLAVLLSCTACTSASESSSEAPATSVEPATTAPSTTSTRLAPTTIDFAAFEAAGESRDFWELVGLEEAVVVDWAERSGFEEFLAPGDIAVGIFVPRRIRIQVDDEGIVTRVTAG